MEDSRHPLDHLIEVMMKTNPSGKVVRIGDDGKVAEEITVQEFARRIYEMENGKTNDSEGNWEIDQEFEIETSKESEEKTAHTASFNKMCQTTDEISALAGRLYRGCKNRRLPFLVRLAVVYAFIRGVMEG